LTHIPGFSTYGISPNIPQLLCRDLPTQLGAVGFRYRETQPTIST